MSDVIEYKCPACGGKLEFSSGSQKMRCPFCESEFDVDSIKDHDNSLENIKDDDMNWETTAGNSWQQSETENMRVYTCKSCGGEIITDPTTSASKCPYCDNPVVMSGNFSGDLKPDYIIPFKLDKEAAKAALINASSVIDKAETKGVIHKNNASRKVSRLASAVNKID